MPLIGSKTPRLFTQPLRELTPDTSLGFDCIRFAEEECGITLLPWQKFLLIAMLELRPDGKFRFRRVVCLVARQSGKTTVIKVLSLYLMQRSPNKTVLGVAQDLSIAKESWTGVVNMVLDVPALQPLIISERKSVRRSNGENSLNLKNRSRYRIAATNGSAGRGLPVNLLVLDELREMKNDSAIAALGPTISAQPDGMIVAISNAGEYDSVVLNQFLDVARSGVQESVGFFEWSAPEGCELDDPDAWIAANPGLGYTVQEDELKTALATMKPNHFRTEHLCQRVDVIDTAIDMSAWQACGDSGGTMDALRDRMAWCLDVAPNNKHATLYAAGIRDDGKIRIEVVRAWDDAKFIREDLPELLENNNPRAFGYFANGPVAAVMADLRQFRQPKPIAQQEAQQACMGFAEQVTARRLVQPNDPLLNSQISHASKKWVGEGWRFTRTDRHDCDAIYAAAGAVHLARTAKPSVGKPRILMPSSLVS